MREGAKRRTINIDLSGVVQLSALIGVTLHLAFIYHYFILIGRIDIFVLSLTENNSLAYLIAFGAIFGIVAFIFLALPSFVIIFSSHLFSGYVPQYKYKKHNTFLITSAILSTIIIYIWAVMLYSPENEKWFKSFYFIVALLLSSFTCTSMKFFIRKLIKPENKKIETWQLGVERLGVSIIYGAMILLASIYTVFVPRIIFQTYDFDNNTYDNIRSILLISIGALATFIPAYFYFLPPKGELKKKLQALMMGVIVFATVIILIAPAVAGVAVFNVARALGMNDSTNRVYYLANPESRPIFSEETWRSEESGYNNDAYLVAKQLYSAGNTVLLCNKKAEFKPYEADSLRDVAKSCLMVDSSWIIKVDVEQGSANNE